MSNLAISVQDLTKTFSFPVQNKEKGILHNLFSPDIRDVRAVDTISFSVEKGEKIAFIGPNGAGKSTTIKMLTGILAPTGGEVSVLGLDPAQERKKLAYRIGTVFGQRSLLLPNLPVTDSFEFFGVMYDMPKADIQARTKELTELFQLAEFIDQPVRKLSLGQRMRSEVAVSLIHRPEIIFLDEPTIGLDVVAKKALRDLLLNINTAEGTTIFLTSHDVGDIETLCDRTVVINHGVVVMDMPTSELTKTYASEKYIDIALARPAKVFPKLPKGIEYAKKEQNLISVVVNSDIIGTKQALHTLLDLFEVDDIDVHDVELETVIRKMYESTATRH